MSLGFQPILMMMMMILVGPLPVNPYIFEDQNESEIPSTKVTKNKIENEDIRTKSSVSSMKKPKAKFSLKPILATNKVITTTSTSQAETTKSEKERDDEYVVSALVLNKASTPMQKSTLKILGQPKTIANTSAFNFIKLNVFMGATYMRTQTDAHKAEILGYINSVRRSLGVANLNFMHWSHIGEIMANLQARLQCTGLNMEEFGEELVMIRSQFGHIYHVTTSKATSVFLPVLQLWNEGSAHYFPTSNSCRKSQEDSCMKYLQLVWWTTSEIGCTYWKCPEVDADVPRDEAHLVVCYFYPKVNFPGERPFINGPPCSRCTPRQQCLDDLCVEEDEDLKSEKYDWYKSYSQIHESKIEEMNNKEEQIRF